MYQITNKMNYLPVKVVDTDGLPNDEWLKYRRTGIGGSDTSALLGISGWGTKRTLYYAKLGIQKEEADSTYRFDFGHFVEPFVAQWFQKSWQKYQSFLERKLDVEIKDILIYKDTWMYRHPLHECMLADLDYRVRITDTAGKTYEGIFECKTTSFYTADEHWDTFGGEHVPPEYESQCRHYMAVTNLDFTIICCLWGNNESNYAVRVVLRDMDTEEMLIAAEEDFWYNNVCMRVAPALDPSHATQEKDGFQRYGIAKLLRDGKIPEIEVDTKETLDAIHQYEQLSAQKDALKKQIENIDRLLDMNKTVCLTALAATSEGGECAEIPSGNVSEVYVIENRISERRGIDMPRLKAEMPDVYKEYSKVSTSERFRIRKIKK